MTDEPEGDVMVAYWLGYHTGCQHKQVLVDAHAAALARAEAAEQRSRMWQWSFRLACDYIDLMMLALNHPFIGWIPRWLLRDLPPHPAAALLTPDAPQEVK